jgi:hypothetical protein
MTILRTRILLLQEEKVNCFAVSSSWLAEPNRNLRLYCSVSNTRHKMYTEHKQAGACRPTSSLPDSWQIRNSFLYWKFRIFHKFCTSYSWPSSYDRPDIRTIWVTTKILVLTYDQSLELRPECRSKPKRVLACAVVNKDPRCVRKRQSEPRYACLWT